jgi:hypothetical protein
VEVTFWRRFLAAFMLTWAPRRQRPKQEPLVPLASRWHRRRE